MTEDKRKSARVSARLEVSFRKARAFLGSGSRIKDISTTGMCISVKQHFPVDSLLEVEIHLQDFKDPVRTLAKVVRIDHRNDSKFPFEMGLQFLDLPLGKRNIINDYIHRSMAEGKEQEIHWID